MLARKAFLVALFCFPAFATDIAFNKYDFLDRFESGPGNFVPEKDPALVGKPVLYDTPLNINMQGFYNAFKQSKKVRIYLGFGKDAAHAGRATEINTMLEELVKFYDLKLSDWKFDAPNQFISFHDDTTDIDYSVQIGDERNAFAKAFENHEVVMYHGHSRYGRGPAFKEYWNYFRMGNVFPVIEVDTRNPYFRTEPIQDTATYPIQTVELSGSQWQYQYEGQKTESSYLPPDSYTKLIPGNDKDLRKAKYLRGKQLFYFYSCSNSHYWKTPLRNLFRPTDKMVFGTHVDGYWGSKPSAVFIASLIRGVDTSTEIVTELNATKDCPNDCFTAY